MPEYLTPGVFVEELPAPQTIEGVSTSTAGFVGAATMGPVGGLPRLVTSPADFARRYGGHLGEEWGDARYLAFAVEGFFANGGQRAYIARVVGDGAAPAARTFRDGWNAALLEDTAEQAAARTTVRLSTLVGVEVGIDLTFTERIAGALATQTVAVAGYDAAHNTVRLAAALTTRFTAARCQVTRAGTPAPAAGVPSLTARAADPGTWGNELRVSVASMIGATGLTRAAAVAAATTLAPVDLAFDAGGPAPGDTSTVLGDATGLEAGSVVRFDNAADEPSTRALIAVDAGTNTISWDQPLVHDYTDGSETVARLSAVLVPDAAPAADVDDATGLAAGQLVRISGDGGTQIARISGVAGSTLTFDGVDYPLATSFDAGATVELANAGTAAGASVDLLSANNVYERAVIEIDDGAHKSYHRVTSVDGSTLTLAAPLGVDVPGGVAVRVIELDLSADQGSTTERFANLSLDPAADNFAPTVINRRSQLITATAEGAATAPPFNLPQIDLAARNAATPTDPWELGGGNDGGQPSAAQVIGDDLGPGQRTGIEALADIDGVSIVAAPGWSDPAVQAALLLHCDLLKDRFAVIDPAEASRLGSGGPDDIIVQRNAHDSLYGAIYYPWLRVRDPLDDDNTDGLLVPPSGHMVGIYARTDIERGVHKAPANEVVRGILDLEVKLGDREQAVLNPININVIRDFRSAQRGLRVWGARVLTSQNAWKYVPVRRLFIFVEESLQEGLHFAVFEPNAEPLWARVRRTIEGFLRRVWIDGALEGVTEAEAFFVKVDRTTMTEDDIANGRLIVLVGIAPVRPAEFVIIRIAQKTREAEA